jgi:putative CocE/NonD family hydrolase
MNIRSWLSLFFVIASGVAFWWPKPGLGSAGVDQQFDALIRDGTIYDGSGQPPRRADVGIKGDRIVAVGVLAGASAKTVIDARDLAVAPGFINMLSWSVESLLQDGRGQSEVRQGVTTQIMGEGNSWGPVNAAIKKRMKAEQVNIKYDIEWNTLGEYLYFLERRGISQNVASFLGATTVREYVLGLDNKKPTPDELERMRRLVEREMRDGALGIASALEYAPAYYADTEELIELCKAAARYKGTYITHMRSQGDRLLDGIDEAIRIGREAKVPVEIYHFTAAGKANWSKLDAAVARIEAARRDGLALTANMYCYTAGAAPLTACIPPWAMAGGELAMRRRLREPADRQRAVDDIRNKKDWPNFYRIAGGADNVVLLGFKQETLRPLQGKTLAKIAEERGRDPVETLLDLLLEDQSSIGTLYFIHDEKNIRKLVKLPWISFGSDEEAQAPEGVFLLRLPHPRAYGCFARVLGKYVRELDLLPLEAAIRKMTGLPATNLGLDRRGFLREGYFADVVVFDPKTIADRATYDKPHQYAVGMRHVFVNGVPVLQDGEHTGAKSGRALWGAGKTGRPANESAGADKQVDLTWGMKVPMRDGVQLNATCYKPQGSKEAVPVIFTMTPYISDTYHDRAMYFARNGYVFALVDVRGRGNSAGKFEPFVHDARDGHDVVEWLARQPWCNGKVAMWGGSYAGFNQWSTLREFPPHLATIVPAAAAHPGVDFPFPNNMAQSYAIQWLTFTSGVTPNQKLFSDAGFWTRKYRQRYEEHVPFQQLDAFVGNPSPHFQKWLEHRRPDEYWDALAPGPDQYRRIELPILTITGHYDGDQPGAMSYYRRHMELGSAKGKAQHYLLMGPWDHAGTRTPAAEVGGVKFGKASLQDLNRLHKEWYDWTMKGGKRPAFLEKPVAYYVAGAEEWRFAERLEAIPTTPRRLYLTTAAGSGQEVFRAGILSRTKPWKEAPARYSYNPLDLREIPGPFDLEDTSAKSYLTDQRLALELSGNGLVYHSDPLPTATDITGYLKLVAWIALDVPDTDFAVDVFEIKRDGTSIALADDRMRARYRESLRQERLVVPGEINRYEFKSFNWFSRRLDKGSRLRVVFYSPNSRYWEKNYNSGAEVATESRKDARTAHVALYQDVEHPSYLEIPVIEVPANK